MKKPKNTQDHVEFFTNFFTFNLKNKIKYYQLTFLTKCKFIFFGIPEQFYIFRFCVFNFIRNFQNLNST